MPRAGAIHTICFREAARPRSTATLGAKRSETELRLPSNTKRRRTFDGHDSHGKLSAGRWPPGWCCARINRPAQNSHARRLKIGPGKLRQDRRVRKLAHRCDIALRRRSLGRPAAAAPRPPQGGLGRPERWYNLQAARNPDWMLTSRRGESPMRGRACPTFEINGPFANKRYRRRGAQSWVVAAALTAMVAHPTLATADEGGVSFWLPGLFGSFAAVPGAPGWAVTFIYIHPSVSATGGKTFQLGTNFVAGVEGRGDLVSFGPTYTLATPVLGGQASLSLFGVGGRNSASVSATLTGPQGNEISGTRTQSLTPLGDLLPQASLKWNRGVNNYMVYAMG